MHSKYMYRWVGWTWEGGLPLLELMYQSTRRERDHNLRTHERPIVGEDTSDQEKHHTASQPLQHDPLYHEPRVAGPTRWYGFFGSLGRLRITDYMSTWHY